MALPLLALLGIRIRLDVDVWVWLARSRGICGVVTCNLVSMG